MASESPPPSEGKPERRKPWYLALALLLALTFGFLGTCEGYGMVGSVRVGLDGSELAKGYDDDADRAAVAASAEDYNTTIDHAKARVFPIAIGSILLGTAVLIFAMRAMARTSWSRAGLLQVIVAQALLRGVAFFLQKDVRAAEERWTAAKWLADAHQAHVNPLAAAAQARVGSATYPLWPATFLTLASLGSLLIVVALTRREARAFFEAAPGSASE